MKILVPTDGSWAAFAAEKYAVELCKRCGGKIVTLHVYDPEISVETWKVKLKRELIRKMQTERDAYEIVDRVKKLGEEEGVEVESVIIKGKGRPSDEIIKYINNRGDIDLIIIAPTGKGHFFKLFLGSTTEGLLSELGRLLQVPVLVVPKREE
jgi:nucleotide-binding universal stress UspA family protein